MTETLSDEDRKLVVLARGALARAESPSGAAVRDGDGRTYAGADVRTRTLTLTGLQVAVASALSSGARSFEAAVVVKGLRGGTDFAYELPMALMNRHLSGVETVFLPGDPQFEHVSSSLVKEVARFGGDITGLVSERVRAALTRRLAEHA